MNYEASCIYTSVQYIMYRVKNYLKIKIVNKFLFFYYQKFINKNDFNSFIIFIITLKYMFTGIRMGILISLCIPRCIHYNSNYVKIDTKYHKIKSQLQSMNIL